MADDVRLLVTPIIIIIVLLTGCDEQPMWRRQVAAEKKADNAAREIEGEQCIARLAARAPRQDAEQDWRRHDRTPIGISYTPHNGPTATQYENACNDDFALDYRPTGKWLTNTSQGFDMWETIPEKRCYYATSRYIAIYNSRMLELAPAEITHFCREQRSLAETQARTNAAVERAAVRL